MFNLKTLLLCVLLAVSGLSQCSAENYGENYTKAALTSYSSKETLIIVVYADKFNCPPCKALKAAIEKNELPSDINFARIGSSNKDAKKIRTSKSVPEIAKYKWDGKDWIRTTMVGYPGWDKFIKFCEE